MNNSVQSGREFAMAGCPSAPVLVSGLVLCLVFLRFGLGLPALLVVLAVSFFYVVFHPREGVWVTFLVLSVAVSTISLDYIGELEAAVPKAYWLWGLGILSVAVAMGAGLWLGGEPKTQRLLWTSEPLTRPLMAFCAVTAVSIVMGYAEGDGLMMVMRQASGLIFLLFFAFLTYKLRLSAAELWLIFTSAVQIVFAYSVVYLVEEIWVNVKMAGVLPAGDFARQRSPILFFSGLFAALLLGLMLFEKRQRRANNLVVALVLTSAAVLSGSRAIVASMIITVAFFVCLKYVNRPSRLILLMGLPILAILLFNPIGGLTTLAQGNGFLEHISDRFVVVPQEDWSFLQRTSEMLAVVEAVKVKPLLGYGMGAGLTWYDPNSMSYVETSFVDSGIGYLLLKMGLVGAFIFAWFCWTALRKTWWLWSGKRHVLLVPVMGTLAFYVVFLPFGPSFFQFLSSFWVGSVLGWLLTVRWSKVSRTTPPEMHGQRSQ